MSQSISRSERVLALCKETLERLSPGEARDRVGDVAARLREPLRLVVAGRVNAGKSTLVNALLGRRIAPTDVSESTKVVTWFRFGFPEMIEVIPREGPTQRLRFVGGEIPRNLGSPPHAIERIVVTLSNAALQELTIIDTPGLASANDDISASTEELLAMTDASRRAASRADALLFVITQAARSDDAAALEGFAQMLGAADSSPVTALGVLGKADKIPGDAEAVAGSLSTALGSRLATVIPVNALLAETALCGALNEEDARNVEAFAAVEPKQRDLALRSVDLFRRLAPLPRSQSDRLLALLDLYGIERAVELISAGADGAGPLSDELTGLSGVGQVRALLDELFGRTADTLKARTALAALEEISWQRVDDAADPELGRLRDRVEELRLEPAMHRIREMFALQRCARGVDLPEELRTDAARLANDGTAAAKLGLPESASRQDLEGAALAGSQRWNAFRAQAQIEQAEVAEVFSRSYALIWTEIGAGSQAAIRL